MGQDKNRETRVITLVDKQKTREAIFMFYANIVITGLS